MYRRAEYQIITERMKEPRKFIQVVMGARQIGKSTVVSGYEQGLDFRLLGGCAQLERKPRVGECHSCD